MKANELMLDDWVSTPNGYRQVKQNFGLDGIYTRLAPEYDYPEDWDEKDLQPIPLTPEILEKNGFKSDTNMFGLCDYELSESYILENRGNRFCFVKRILSYRSTFHMFDVKYVHELQHVFRFCGIDKEIMI